MAAAQNQNGGVSPEVATLPEGAQVNWGTQQAQPEVAQLPDGAQVNWNEKKKNNPPQPQPSTAKQIWDKANTPLFQSGYQETAERDYANAPPTLEESKHPYLTAVKKGLAGAEADAQKTGRSITSPLGLAMLAGGPITELLGQAVPSAGTVLKALGVLGGVGFTGQGLYQAGQGAKDIHDKGLTPETAEETLGGLSQAALGAHGTLEATPEAVKRPIEQLTTPKNLVTLGASAIPFGSHVAGPYIARSMAEGVLGKEAANRPLVSLSPKEEKVPLEIPQRTSPYGSVAPIQAPEAPAPAPRAEVIPQPLTEAPEVSTGPVQGQGFTARGRADEQHLLPAPKEERTGVGERTITGRQRDLEPTPVVPRGNLELPGGGVVVRPPLQLPAAPQGAELGALPAAHPARLGEELREAPRPAPKSVAVPPHIAQGMVDELNSRPEAITPEVVEKARQERAAMPERQPIQAKKPTYAVEPDITRDENGQPIEDARNRGPVRDERGNITSQGGFAPQPIQAKVGEPLPQAKPAYAGSERRNLDTRPSDENLDLAALDKLRDRKGTFPTPEEVKAAAIERQKNAPIQTKEEKPAVPAPEAQKPNERTAQKPNESTVPAPTQAPAPQAEVPAPKPKAEETPAAPKAEEVPAAPGAENAPAAEEPKVGRKTIARKLTTGEEQNLSRFVGKTAASHFAQVPNEALEQAMKNATREQLAAFANKKGFFKPGDPMGAQEWTPEDFSRGKNATLEQPKGVSVGKAHTLSQILSHNLGDEFVEHVTGKKPGDLSTVPASELRVGDTFIDDKGEPRRVTEVEGDKVRAADGDIRTYEGGIQKQGALNSAKAAVAQGGKFHPIGLPNEGSAMKPMAKAAHHPSGGFPGIQPPPEVAFADNPVKVSYDSEGNITGADGRHRVMQAISDGKERIAVTVNRGGREVQTTVNAKQFAKEIGVDKKSLAETDRQQNRKPYNTPVQPFVQARPNGFNVTLSDASGKRIGNLHVDYSGPGKATVKAVDVDENAQRQGIATRLYTAARDELRNRGITTLTGALEGSGPVQIRDKVFGRGNTKYFHGGEEVDYDKAVKIMDKDYGYLRAETKIGTKSPGSVKPRGMSKIK